MPQALGSVPEVLADLAKALRSLRVRWYLFGAQALVLRGLSRATAHVDVTVLLGTIPTERLLAMLRRHGLPPAIEEARFVATTRVVPVVHRRTGLLVDIVLGGPGIEERFAAAAETVRVGRIRVPVATATHLVVMKVLAGRPKDLDDAAGLLAMSVGRIDADELDELSQALSRALADDGVLDNLREVRRRSARLRGRRA
jgi:hypothetical protein